VSRRRRSAGALGGTREDLAARLRARHEGGPGWSYWRRLVERLEAGEEVVVPGWLVRLPGRVRVEPDGTLTPAVPVRAGLEIVDWRPAC
jgi:hypothetical protein